MDLKQLVTILLVVFVLGGKCRIHGGEGPLHGAEATSQRRTVQRTPLFNEVAQDLEDLIQGVFTKTDLKNVTESYVIKNELMVVDTTANNTEVTSHFPEMVKHYHEYKTDLRLTRDRATFFVDDEEYKGHDRNAAQWAKTIRELRKLVFNLIDEAIGMVRSMSLRNNKKKKLTKTESQRQQEKANQHQRNIGKLLRNILKRINHIINQKEYVDQDAKMAFTSNKQNANRLPEMELVEEHIKDSIHKVFKRARLWAIEAANFYIKKLK